MKIKTRKSVAKRFWYTGSGKLRRRQSGQDHFNSRDSEKKTKGKRMDETVTDTHPNLRAAMPYKK